MSYQSRNARREKSGAIAKANRGYIPGDLEIRERGEVICKDGHDRTQRILDVLQAYCEANNLQVDFANEYGEPGYTNPATGKCIIFANWNDIPAFLGTRIEEQGHIVEYSDEWYVDHDHGSKAWRTQPDHMGWRPQLRFTYGDVLTPDDEPGAWIDDASNSYSPLPSEFDTDELTMRGFGKSNALKFDRARPTLNSVAGVFEEGYEFVLVETDDNQTCDVWTRKASSEDETGAEFCEYEDRYYIHKE